MINIEYTIGEHAVHVTCEVSPRARKARIGEKYIREYLNENNVPFGRPLHHKSGVLRAGDKGVFTFALPVAASAQFIQIGEPVEMEDPEITIAISDIPEIPVDYTSLTKSELIEILEVEGIPYSKSASKKLLCALLTQEG